jgi:hypothetical protein
MDSRFLLGSDSRLPTFRRNLLLISAELKQEPGSSACQFLGLIIDPEDSVDIFLRNVRWLYQRTTRRYIPEYRTHYDWILFWTCRLRRVDLISGGVYCIDFLALWLVTKFCDNHALSSSNIKCLQMSKYVIYHVMLSTYRTSTQLLPMLPKYSAICSAISKWRLWQKKGSVRFISHSWILWRHFLSL